MTIPDYVEDYFWLKYPEKRRVYADTCRKAVEGFLQSRGVYTDKQREEFIELAGHYWDERRVAEAGRADKTVLELYGLRVEDLKSFTEDRRKKVAGGKHPNHAARYMTTAFSSFLHSERHGSTFAEAINHASDICGPNVNPKSLRKWLKVLIHYRVCDIPAPTRRKKT